MSDSKVIPSFILNRRNEREMGGDYIKYVQECNEKVKTTGNSDFKAEPEFVWEAKNRSQKLNKP